MNIGNVKFIKPAHPSLKKLIKGYYVHTAVAEDFHTKVTFFQNITTTISNYRHSVCSSNGRYRKQQFKEGVGFSSMLVGLVDRYQQVEFVGPLDRLAIVFYPLGINHFVKKPLGQLLQKHHSPFDYFGTKFTTLLEQAYSESHLQTKRDILDNFFVQELQVPSDSKLMKAVALLPKRGMVKMSSLIKTTP